MSDIKDITTNLKLVNEACDNAILTDSKKRRRQTFRLRELLSTSTTVGDSDSDVVKATHVILKAMDSVRMIRYGAQAYVEWTGTPPEDLLREGISPDHRYQFSSTNLKDPIQMYTDYDAKVEQAVETLLMFIFNAAAGIDLRNKLTSLECMALEHINLSVEHATPDEVETLTRFATFVDDQNGQGAFAAGLLYPIFNNAYGKKRKHAMFGYGSNTGKGLLLSIISKLYVGAPLQMPVRPAERDVYSAGAWNKLIVNRWIVTIGDSAESDLTYDFMKNLYEQPLSISGKNERSKEMFYGNVYIATNSQQDFFADKEIYSRVFFLAMFKDVDKALGEDAVSVLDKVHRDSVVQYLIAHQEEARQFWKTYSTPESFYSNSEDEVLFDAFKKKFDNQLAPVRDVKAWVNNPKRYTRLTKIIKEYIGDSVNHRVNGKQCRVYDLRNKEL